MPCPDDSEVTFVGLELKTAERKDKGIKTEVKTEPVDGAAQPQATQGADAAQKVPKKRGRKPKQQKEAPPAAPETNGVPLGMDQFKFQGLGHSVTANGSNENSMSSGRYSDHLTQDRSVSPSVESKVAAWHAANMAHYQAMSSSNKVPTTEAASLESLLPQGSVLVKQEGAAAHELSEYGIPMMGHPHVSTSAPSVPTTSGGHPSQPAMGLPPTTAGYMHPMMYQQMHYQAQAEMNARRSSQRH